MSATKPWDILQVAVTRSYLANDSNRLGPEVALVIGAAPLAGEREGLARKSRRYHVNKAAPLSAVKGMHIIPDGERLENPILLPLHKNFTAIRVKLDGADDPVSKEQAAEYRASSAREQNQLIQASPL